MRILVVLAEEFFGILKLKMGEMAETSP